MKETAAKLINKISDILIENGYGLEKFSEKKIDVIERTSKGSEHKKVGKIYCTEAGHITLRLNGYKNEIKKSGLMTSNLIEFEESDDIKDVAKKVKDFIKKFKQSNKKLNPEPKFTFKSYWDLFKGDFLNEEK